MKKTHGFSINTLDINVSMCSSRLMQTAFSDAVLSLALKGKTNIIVQVKVMKRFYQMFEFVLVLSLGCGPG